MKKKILSAGIVMIMLTALFSSFAVTAEGGSPFTVTFNSVQKDVQAGTAFDINFSLWSSIYADDVTASVSYNAETFLPTTLDTVKKVGDISAGAGKNVSLRISTNSKMRSGYYPLVLTFAGEDPNNIPVSGTYTTYISIVNPNADEEKDPSVTIEKFTSPTATVTAGKEFDLTFSMTNGGGQTAKDVNVQIANLTSETFIPTKLETVEKVGDIASKKSVSKTIRLKTSENLKTGSHPLEISYTYINGEGTAITGKYTTYISVYNPNKGEDTGEVVISKPRIIISNYELDVDSIAAGKVFNFSFTLENTSSTTDVKNMKVTLSSADGIFTAAEGSNSFFTKQISKGGTSSYSINLQAKAGADAKAYPLTISIDYEDASGKGYDSTETINLIVTQPVRFEVSNVNIPMESYGYGPCMISFRYFNKSKTALANFAIDVEGDFYLEAGEEYIGSLASNSYDEYEGMIFPNGTGSLSGVIVFKYEDAMGNEQRIEEPFSIEVIEETFEEFPDGEFPDDKFPDGEMPVDGDVSEDGASGIKIVLIVVGCVVVAGAAVVVIIKVRKKKKLENDLDDEE